MVSFWIGRLRLYEDGRGEVHIERRACPGEVPADAVARLDQLDAPPPTKDHELAFAMGAPRWLHLTRVLDADEGLVLVACSAPTDVEHALDGGMWPIALS